MWGRGGGRRGVTGEGWGGVRGLSFVWYVPGEPRAGWHLTCSLSSIGQSRGTNRAMLALTAAKHGPRGATAMPKRACVAPAAAPQEQHKNEEVGLGLKRRRCGVDAVGSVQNADVKRYDLGHFLVGPGVHTTNRFGACANGLLARNDSKTFSPISLD